MPKLTDTQLVILSAAASRKNHAVLPLPDTLKPNKAAITRVINSLIKRKLVTERRVSANAPYWRQEDDRKVGLFVTKAGLSALGLDDQTPAGSTTSRTKVAGPAAGTEAPSSNDKSSKADAVVTLLERPEGAGIEAIRAATAWQPHSIRAFVSGLRKKGIDIIRLKDDEGKSVYSIPGA